MDNYRVLVVDDCIDEATVLCDGLELNGYRAEAVYTGLSALERCRAGGVQLVLLDVGLPDVEGYEVCRRLKDDPETADIPVIFVTARGSSEDVSLGYNLGAVGYIVKPYNLPIVMVHVDHAMRTRPEQDGETAPALSMLGDPTFTDPLTGLRNRRYLLERLQEETEKSRRYGYPICLLLVDVEEITPIEAPLDGFFIDDLLCEIAMAMRNNSRNFDIIARYEGNTFAALLPHTTKGDGMSYARKIDGEVRAATLHDPCCPMLAQLSFGIAAHTIEEPARDADHVLTTAMRDLLRSKSSTVASEPGKEFGMS